MPTAALKAPNALISPFARATMGHPVERRLGGAVSSSARYQQNSKMIAKLLLVVLLLECVVCIVGSAGGSSQPLCAEDEQRRAADPVQRPSGIYGVSSSFAALKTDDGGAAAASVYNMTAVIDLPTEPLAANPLIMGCHSDSGYVVQPFGLESQMVVGESFEGNWTGYRPLDNRRGALPNITWNRLHDGQASFARDTAAPFHGLASQRIELTTGSFAFVSNRGMGNEGLVLHGGKEYTGYVFARAAKPVTLTVALRDVMARTKPAKVLAAVTVPI
eukprot:COSAG01_NODE_5639_length_4125_cov_16.441288_9_plen_274_part_01